MATGAILIASLLSFASFFIWVGGHRDTIFPDNDEQVTVLADPGPVTSSERLVISDWGGNARGTVVFFEGARKAARLAARQQA